MQWGARIEKIRRGNTPHCWSRVRIVHTFFKNKHTSLCSSLLFSASVLIFIRHAFCVSWFGSFIHYFVFWFGYLSQQQSSVCSFRFHCLQNNFQNWPDVTCFGADPRRTDSIGSRLWSSCLCSSCDSCLFTISKVIKSLSSPGAPSVVKTFRIVINALLE